MLLLITLGISLYITVTQRQHISDLQTEIQVKGDTISYYKDKNGLLVSRIGTYEKSMYELKHFSDSIEKKMFAEAKNNRIKDRKIKELSYLSISIRDSLGAPVDTISDSLISTATIPEIYHSNFSNGFLNADVYMIKDKMKLNYSYDVEIYRTKHMVRPQSDCKLFRLLGISFKKKKEVVDYKLSDPNGSVINVREIIIKK